MKDSSILHGPRRHLRSLRLVLDGRLVEQARVQVQGQVLWVPAGLVATRWGAQLDVGEDLVGWRDARTGRTVVFRRGIARAELDGRDSRPLTAAPDWADGQLRFPVDAVALAGEGRWFVDRSLGILFLTRVDPYLSRFRILLDPGHGGTESGATFPDGTLEKDLNWRVARRLAVLLRASGAVVGLSRPGDQNRTVAGRCRSARQLQAELSVSIHHTPSGPASGSVEAYYGRHGDSRRLAAALMAAVGRELRVPGRGIREAHMGVLACLPSHAALVQTCFGLLPAAGRHGLARRFAWLCTREALGLLQGIRAFCSEAHRDSVAWPASPV